MQTQLITNQSSFDDVLQKLEISLAGRNVDFKNIAAVCILTALPNVVSGNRPFQKNASDMKQILPVVMRSEYFKEWRYKVKASTWDSSGTQIFGNLVIRPNLQNGYEYVQLTVDDSLATLKSSLKINDKFVILKFRNLNEYQVYTIPNTDTLFDNVGDLIAINNSLVLVDKTNFEPSLIESKKGDTRHPINQILYGPPGTGKTYNCINHALAIIKGLSVDVIVNNQRANASVREKDKAEFDYLVEQGQIQFVTFHQSFSYEDFVEGVKAAVNDNGQLEYRVEDGIFKKMCSLAEQSDNQNKNFVLIIDEINRGNISKIFGELITLIEDSKRLKEPEELRLKLTYSSDHSVKDFGVPNNLYLIGTMNSADKSISLVDTALRRRFEFIEYTSDYKLLNNNVEGIDLQRMLRTINERIEILLDKDHIIGHAFFVNVMSKNDLCSVFKNKLIPLLDEYFYGDFEKIQLVLGDNSEYSKSLELKLIIEKKSSSQRNLFGKEVEGFEEKTVYQINPLLVDQRYEELSSNVFVSIYSNTTSATEH